MFWVNGFCILLGKKPYNLNVNLKKIKGIQFAAFPKSFFLIKTSIANHSIKCYYKILS